MASTMATMGSREDSDAVARDVPAESTLPEAAPEHRSAPVVVPARPRQDRQRRSTVASPIPALLAASMRGGASEQIPASKAAGARRPTSQGIPTEAGAGQTTSRLAEPLQAELLREGEPEYEIEYDKTS